MLKHKIKIVTIATFLLASRVCATVNPALIKAADDFSHVAEQVNPWVVNIATSQIVRQRYPQFWNDFFDENFTNQGRAYRRQSLGSGIILSSDGKILTNSHVVLGADEISVRLDNGDIYPAKVLGEDEGVDLAVLKIEPKLALPAAQLGDSSNVRVGEWAIAIGNPFGFDHSLTVGVISAKERTNVFGEEGKAKYQNFLQTDASINPGNSGGPLCNIKGEVIGINTAISTPSQGSIGIGFAIPINMVKRAVPDLIKSGHIITPRPGFYTQDIDTQLSIALQLGNTQGVLVTDVATGGAADKAGLKRGDVITLINGKNVSNSGELKTHLYEAKPENPMLLNLLRKGKPMELRLDPLPQQNLSSTAWHGIEADENTREKAQAMGLAVAQGMIVNKVLKKSSAEQIGLMPGDVILEVNQQRLENIGDWKKISRSIEDSSDAILLIVRGRSSAYVVLPAEK